MGTDKIGIPISLQFSITSIGSMVLQTAVNGFGSSVIAGFTAAGRVEQLTNIPMSGLGVGNMTLYHKITVPASMKE